LFIGNDKTPSAVPDASCQIGKDLVFKVNLYRSGTVVIADFTHVERSAAERTGMYTAEQYGARALEYFQLVKIAKSPTEVSEFRRLERTFTELADNAQWAADNYEKTLHTTSCPTGGQKSTAEEPLST
jgi:hypothetical protein